MIFSRASRTILDHPLHKNIRTLGIRDRGFLAGNLKLAVSNIGKLLGSMGPLERLDLVQCDPRLYLDPFFDNTLFPDAIQSTSFPPIELLTIHNPVHLSSNNDRCATAIVRLDKSQRARGMPLEHITLQPPALSRAVEELLHSVDTV